jgi:hypothetical protein
MKICAGESVEEVVVEEVSTRRRRRRGIVGRGKQNDGQRSMSTVASTDWCTVRARWFAGRWWWTSAEQEQTSEGSIQSTLPQKNRRFRSGMLAMGHVYWVDVFPAVIEPSTGEERAAESEVGCAGGARG